MLWCPLVTIDLTGMAAVLTSMACPRPRLIGRLPVRRAEDGVAQPFLERRVVAELLNIAEPQHLQSLFPSTGSILQIGIKRPYLAGSSVPRLMISIEPV